MFYFNAKRAELLRLNHYITIAVNMQAILPGSMLNIAKPFLFLYIFIPVTAMLSTNSF